jgi:hypothetical protein
VCAHPAKVGRVYCHEARAFRRPRLVDFVQKGLVVCLEDAPLVINEAEAVVVLVFISVFTCK